MRIKSMKIRNGLQHESLEAEFGDFNVIIGPNGCGKSSVAELIGYALTNKFTWPGTLETMIRQGEDSGDIVLELESEGRLITLKTALGKTSRSLDYEGLDKPIRKSADVLEELERGILRTPFELVNEASIVRQDHLSSGLFTTQARRQQAFQRLAGMTDIELKRKQLADMKALCTPHMVSFNTEEFQRQVLCLEERNKKVAGELDALEMMDEEKYNKCKSILLNLEHLKRFNEQLATLTQERAELVPILEEAEKSLSTAKEELSKLEESVNIMQDDYVQALSAIGAAESAAKRVAEFNRLSDKKVVLYNTLAELESATVPDAFEGQAQLVEFRDIQQSAKGLIAEANKTLEAFTSDMKECPTCHTVISDPVALIESARATKADNVEVFDIATSEIAKLQAQEAEWRRALTKYSNDLSVTKSAISECEVALEQFNEGGEIPNVDAARDIVAAYSTMSKSLSSRRESIESIKKVAYEAEKSVNAYNVQIESVRSNLTGLDGAPDDSSTVVEATKYVSKYEANRDKRTALTAALSEVSTQLSSSKESLEDSLEKEKKSKKFAEYASYIEFARTALHRDNFPSGKVKSFIDKVLVNAEAYLRDMEVDFTISYDPEDGFVAYFPEDGKTMRADRLSGGEKVVFSLAFRFAVNEVKSETGFLFLDEPTAHLDDHHVEKVVEVLGIVKKKLEGRVQIFVITHDERMMSVADSTLEVHKASA